MHRLLVAVQPCNDHQRAIFRSCVDTFRKVLGRRSQPWEANRVCGPALSAGAHFRIARPTSARDRPATQSIALRKGKRLRLFDKTGLEGDGPQGERKSFARGSPRTRGRSG